MQPKKHYFAHIPTIAIFIVFAMSAPLGVLLFILKSIDKNAEKEEKAAAQAQADYRSDLGPAPAQTAPRQETEPAYGHDVPTKEQKDAKERHKLLTTLCTIGGAVFLFAGFSTLFMDGADSMMEAFTAIAQMLGGGAALLTGLRMDRTRKLERLLDKIAGDRDNIPLDELFAAAGIDAAKGRAAVESAISHGYFGADAYIDNRTATLVVRGAAPQPPKQPEPKPAPAPADQYAALLQQLPGGALIIDLASLPGGTDFAAAEELGLHAEHALALPGRCAPQTAGALIAQTVLAILEERDPDERSTAP